MATPNQTTTIDLAARFPGIVIPDTRPGYNGFAVEKDKLVEVATAIRDELGFDLLTAVTGVDYLPKTKWKWSITRIKPPAGPAWYSRFKSRA